MPQNADGTWRPFNDLDKAQAVNYAQNLINQGIYSDKEILWKVGNKFDWHDSDGLAGSNYIRQAHRSVDAAAALNNLPGAAPAGISIPNVPTVGTGVGQVIHDVLITAIDPDTNTPYTFRGEVVNPTPMSPSDLREYFESDPSRLLRLRGSPRPSNDVLARIEFDVDIRDVGRGVASNV